MKYVQELATWVEARWREQHYDADAFAQIATQALSELPAHEHVTPGQLLNWSLTTDPLPPQDGAGNRFGEPSIRLFDNGRFFIQALFWFESTTSIHQHSFSGAFEVLAGSSLHSHYAFTVNQRFNEHLKFGELKLQQVELLPQGAVRAIRHGDRFIHSLFHLEHPSVSFLVRTHNDVESGPLYSYLKPGIAFNSFHVSPRVNMLREVLLAADKLGDGSVDELVALALRDADAETALHALLAYQRLVPALEWPALSPKLERLLQPRDSTWANTMRGTLIEQERLRLIVEARRDVHTPELRFFLALLLNVPTASQIKELIETRFAKRKPVDQIVDWVRELWDTTIQNADGQRVSVLGLDCEEHIKKPALAILRAQLDGESDAAIVRRFPQYGSVSELCTLWREQPLLAGLFQ